MYENVETKCMKLFGDCPLNMDDLRAAKESNYSEEDLIAEAARKFHMNEQNAFSKALRDWMDGNKLQISTEEAKKRNEYAKNAQAIIESRNSMFFVVDSPINWEAFPDDDPTICFYLGYTFDAPLCQWASNYKKA